MSPIVIVLIGFVGGIFSGAFGIGGGAVMVPALVYLLRLTQHQAQGTTLALMVPPIEDDEAVSLGLPFDDADDDVEQPPTTGDPT